MLIIAVYHKIRTYGKERRLDRFRHSHNNKHNPRASFPSSRKKTGKTLKCPNCGNPLGHNGSSLKVMCGDKHISSVRHSGRMIITESTEHYIPTMVCENCIKKRKNIKVITSIMFLFVIPLVLWIMYGATLGIVFFVIGLAIWGSTLNSLEKLHLPIDEVEKIAEEQIRRWI